jgi:hypothetical protein
MNLTTTTQSLRIVLGEAKVTTDCDITAAWGDATVPFVLGATQGTSNGTTPVTAVAAPASNVQRQVKEIRLHNNDTIAHTVTLQFDNNGTISILDGPVTVAVGGNYVYTPSSTSGTAGGGGSWQEISVTTVAAAAASGTIVLPTGFRRYRATVQGVALSTTAQLQMTLSQNGGSSFLSSYTVIEFFLSGTSTIAGTTASASVISLYSSTSNNSNALDVTFELYPGNGGTSQAFVRGSSTALSTAITALSQTMFSGVASVTAAINAFQIAASAGTYSATIVLEGML